MITGLQNSVNGDAAAAGAGRRNWRIAVFVVLMLWGAKGFSRSSKDRLRSIPRSASMTFMERDGNCVDGPIAKIDPKAVTVQQGQKPPVVLQRGDLIQVSQGDALVFSARSSWDDVQAVHLMPHESLMVKLRNGKVIKGKPLEVTADGMVFKLAPLVKIHYAKNEIATVDYLRMKPDSDAFDYFTQEAPALLFFYPEFYDGLKGLEGRIPVRLYDAVMAQDDRPLACLRR